MSIGSTLRAAKTLRYLSKEAKIKVDAKRESSQPARVLLRRRQYLYYPVSHFYRMSLPHTQVTEYFDTQVSTECKNTSVLKS